MSIVTTTQAMSIKYVRVLCRFWHIPEIRYNAVTFMLCQTCLSTTLRAKPKGTPTSKPRSCFSSHTTQGQRTFILEPFLDMATAELQSKNSMSQVVEHWGSPLVGFSPQGWSILPECSSRLSRGCEGGDPMAIPYSCALPAPPPAPHTHTRDSTWCWSVRCVKRSRALAGPAQKECAAHCFAAEFAIALATKLAECKTGCQLACAKAWRCEKPQ